MSSNRITPLSLLILALFLQTFPSAKATEKEHKPLTENQKIIRNYLAEVKEKKIIIPLGEFGWKKVKRYWQTVPELKAAREEFEKANKELTAILDANQDLKTLQNELRDKKITRCQYGRKRCELFQTLQKESEAYRTARTKREEALYASNLKTLEYIVADYAKQGKVFPVDWIPNYKCRKCQKPTNGKPYTLNTHQKTHTHCPHNSTGQAKSGEQNKTDKKQPFVNISTIPKIKDCKAKYLNAQRRLEKLLSTHRDYNKVKMAYSNQSISRHDYILKLAEIIKDLDQNNPDYQKTVKARNTLRLELDKSIKAHSPYENYSDYLTQFFKNSRQQRRERLLKMRQSKSTTKKMSAGQRLENLLRRKKTQAEKTKRLRLKSQTPAAAK